MKLELEKHEVTIILKALSTQPYSEVASLIRKIVDQTSRQE